MTDTAVTWLRPEFQGRESELIHLAAGADLVGVTRAAVSNWAARHANFPRIVLLTGPERKRFKWVVRKEFLAFARQQLNKPRGPNKKPAPHRPRVEIRAGQAAHWEAQVQRLVDLEARQAAALKRTRERLAAAEANLKQAREGLAAEISAAQRLAEGA